jgi:DNA-binding NtrC family response regulator
MNRVALSQAPVRTGATALLVSPFVSDHLAIRTLFSPRGWVLHSAFTFQEALYLLREEAIPVVICHRHLLDGDWRILAQWSRRPLKVIVVSKSGDATLARAAAGNAFGVLFTPFDPQAAERMILRAWNSSQREREVSKVARKLPSRVGAAAEHRRVKQAASGR